MTITPEEIARMRDALDEAAAGFGGQAGPARRLALKLLSAYETEKARADRLAKALKNIREATHVWGSTEPDISDHKGYRLYSIHLIAHAALAEEPKETGNG